MARGSAKGERRGGRDPGTPNKATALKEAALRTAAQLCADRQYNPIEAMIAVALDSENPVELRARMHEQVASYVYPRLKAVEMKMGDGQGNTYNLPELLEALRKA